MQYKAALHLVAIASRLSYLNKSIHLFTLPQLHIPNLSVTSGMLPGIYKTTKVIPRFKGGDHTDNGNIALNLF